MLELVFPVQYPLTRADNPWADGIDAQLLALADRIYQESPFDLAVLGEEASALRGIERLTTEELAKGGVLLPPPLVDKLSPETSLGIVRPSGLRWFPWRIL